MGYSRPHYFYDNFVSEVEVGDKVYFHYTAIDLDSRIEYEDERYYAVPLEMVWCKVKDGVLTMIGGRVFCEAMEYEYDDIEEIEVGGVKIKVRMSGSGLVTEMNPKTQDINRARLIHIGTPLKNLPEVDVVPGDVIYYAKDADFENLIEGKKYFCMTQEDILAKQI